MTNEELKNELIKVGFPTDAERRMIKKRATELGACTLITCSTFDSTDAYPFLAVGNSQDFHRVVKVLIDILSKAEINQKLNEQTIENEELQNSMTGIAVRQILLDIISIEKNFYPAMPDLYPVKDRLDEPIYYEDVERETVNEALLDVDKAAKRAAVIMQTHMVKEFGYEEDEAKQAECMLISKNRVSEIVNQVLGMSEK